MSRAVAQELPAAVSKMARRVGDCFMNFIAHDTAEDESGQVPHVASLKKCEEREAGDGSCYTDVHSIA